MKKGEKQRRRDNIKRGKQLKDIPEKGKKPEDNKR
jgi:hypothetical protein